MTHIESTSTSKIHLIEDLIASKDVAFFPYTQFSNITHISPGIYGSEWDAKWTTRNINVQLKSFNHVFDKHDEAIQKFIKQLREVAKLPPHNNISTFHDTKKQMYFVILESTANGLPLPEFLKRSTTLSWTEKFKLAKQISLGIQHLHNNSIVFKELNTYRVIVEEGELKITGVGLSATNDSSVAQTLFDGSQLYKDPWILQDSAYKTKKSSDIYSLGIIFWELTSGRRPFSNDPREMSKLTTSIMNGERETPIADTPKEYSDLYQRCWERNADKRPSIGQIVQALSLIETGDAIFKRRDSEDRFEFMETIDEIDNQRDDIALVDDDSESIYARGSVYSQFSQSSHHHRTTARERKIPKEFVFSGEEKIGRKWWHSVLWCI
ncbi:9485_t:CDS:2 [Ambispora gerdemannii]|uniref:9485_t:CDS:1 n=1 Tax=Ambispora gerdemannii TaxID=144530 RepID=A0A9N8W9G7_9GLOM|nr:9485_t:CDS:2 [Ambispora gerdemannii]